VCGMLHTVAPRDWPGMAVQKAQYERALRSGEAWPSR
jgi:hypothetical protein